MMTETVTISLDAVIAMSGRSRRTWWRRIEEGSISKLPADARGRTLLVFGEIRPALGMALTDEEVAMIARADAGDALAQAEAGAMFALRSQKTSGAGSREPGAGSREPGAGSREPGAGSREPGAGSNYTIARLFTGWSRRPRRGRQMPCTGWECCTLPGRVRVATASIWH